MRTLCTLIKDPAADTVLGPYAELLSQARHWAFKEIHILQRPVAEIKKEAIVRFGLTARQFNGLNLSRLCAQPNPGGSTMRRRGKLDVLLTPVVVRPFT